MAIDAALFSSDKTEWETPPELFENLDEEFGFTLDPAASHENAKCERYFTIDDDGLSKPWSGNVWLNPPYGRNITGRWVEKTYSEVLNGVVEFACVLLPARTDTRWFHSYVMPGAVEVRFVKGRLKFVGAESAAPFPSMLVFFDKSNVWSPRMLSCDKVGNPLI